MATLTPSDLDTLTFSQLKSLVKHGIVSIMTNAPLIAADAMTTKYDTPEYQQFAHLRGVPIGVREAARKYDVPSPTISRWVQKGIIAKLGEEKNVVLIDEADIAYCATIRKQNPGAGKWLFNADGTPYIPK